MYKEGTEAKGFVISGSSPDGQLAELIELRDHPFFMSCQFHPELLSRPNLPHPIFFGFVRTALQQRLG
jgi:CTP synthase